MVPSQVSWLTLQVSADVGIGVGNGATTNSQQVDPPVGGTPLLIGSMQML
jgi:hypothetical protein